MAQNNSDLVRQFFSGLEQGSLSDDQFTEDVHFWTCSSGDTDKARFMGAVTLLASLFKGDLKYDVITQTEQDNRIATEVKSLGTLTNGETYGNTHAFFFSFEDGKIASVSEFMIQDLMNEKLAPLIHAAMSQAQQ